MRDEDFDSFMAEVRARTDLLDVVSHYVQLKRKGNRYWGCCPFHQEDTPSFSVVPDKGFFYCFGCHAGGDALKFISQVENITYFEAAKMQAERLGIKLPTENKTAKEIEHDRRMEDLRKVHQMASDFFHNCLTVTHYGKAGREYFSRRGISKETIEEFHLGYAPNAWDKLTEAFLKREIPQKLLLESGLVVSRKSGTGVYDQFRNRVMIPIMDERGKVVAFGGRVLDDSTPKYLNSPESALFNKRKILFGLNRSKKAIQQAGYVLIVEGYMDAISVFGAGFRNVVASLGTAFTHEHARKLLRYAKEFRFCYDSDEAGQRATVRAMLIAQQVGAQVKIARVPDGKDPDDYVKKHGGAAFQQVIEAAEPLLEYHLQHVLQRTNHDELAGKLAALQELLPVLSTVADAATQLEYSKRLSQALLLDEGIIREELRRHGRKQEGYQPPVPRAIANQRDTALTRSGRILIHAIWEDWKRLAYVRNTLNAQDMQDVLHREILQFVLSKESREEAERCMQELSEEASNELSKAIVEGFGVAQAEVMYTDALKALQKAQYQAKYRACVERAEKIMQSNPEESRLVLAEAKKIKQKMDGLYVE